MCTGETRPIALELKLQPQGENCALSAPINLIRIPDMKAGGIDISSRYAVCCPRALGKGRKVAEYATLPKHLKL